MSEVINNREHRRNVLKELITELHNGSGVEDVKRRFEETFGGVSASEISEVEQALIMDGMPVSEVQRLCDVHAAVFKGSIEDIHRAEQPATQPGHPLEVMKQENRAIEALLARVKPQLDALSAGDASATAALREEFTRLGEINIHYQKKENILFPYLEKYGITAPPKVMWGVDDEVRQLVKETISALDGQNAAVARAKADEAVNRVAEMIFKEENILFPMMRDTFTPDEWKHIADDSDGYGYCLIGSAPQWTPETAQKQAQAAPASSAAETGKGTLTFSTGGLDANEIESLLNTLPFDVTFVDKDDTVKYFSQGNDRIFPRTKAVIGRKVTNCHPPASVHIVEKIVSDFKSGAKDHEDFWIRMGERYVLIRYFAVRDAAGAYLGTLEVTQDIAPIQTIQGEKRLMSE